jgi:serine/threonine protein kinase
MSYTNIEEFGLVELPSGKKIGKRWKVIDKLDEGECGVVYLVEDRINQGKAALKAESNFMPSGSFLKSEIQVLKRMVDRKFVAQLFDSGKKERYSYIVMSLFGNSLLRLFEQCKREFSVSTQIRLGMQILYGLKQLHDIGYIHRDIKPGNLAVGYEGSDARVVHLLDFGLARKYVLSREGKIREPRENILFRGTTKYCSINTHSRNEQSRSDDLWSMMYVLVEMRGALPWDQLIKEREIIKIKKSIADEELLSRSPPEMIRITEHLRTLNYYARPDYQLIFDVLQEIMSKYNIQYSDPFDWELNESTEKLSHATDETEDFNELPFAPEEFSKDELGL